MRTNTPESDKLFYYLGYPCVIDPYDARMLCEKLEQERDKYAGLLCDAMQYAYACEDQRADVSALISAFEALELTPANGSC